MSQCVQLQIHILQVKHITIVFLKIYAQQTSIDGPTVDDYKSLFNFQIEQNANFYFVSLILKFAICHCGHQRCEC